MNYMNMVIESSLSILVVAAIATCGAKKQDTLTSTVTVTPVKAGGAITSAFAPTFSVTAQISDPSMSDKVTVSGGELFYTTDGTAPVVGSSNSVVLNTGNMTSSTSGYTMTSEALPSISAATTTIKYIAQVSFAQQIESSSAGGKKTSESDFTGTSEVATVTYTFGTSSSSSSSSTSTTAAVAIADSVTLLPAATTGATAPTAAYCFGLYAKPVDSSGTVITTPSDVNFTLASVTGSGAFYSDNSCTAVITGSTIAADSSSKTIFYKDNTREAVSLQATYSGKAGTAYAKTLGNPYIAAMSMASVANSTHCQAVSLYMTNAASSTMVESTTQATTVVATKTGGTTTNPHFYTDASCLNQISESGNGVSNLTINANQVGANLYFDAGTQGTYTYTLDWTCGNDHGTFTASFVFYHI